MNCGGAEWKPQFEELVIWQDLAHAIDQTDNKSLTYIFGMARTEMNIVFGRVLFSFYTEKPHVSIFLSKNEDQQYYSWV